jgi:hypothetical protein
MKPDVTDALAWSNGFRITHDDLEGIRFREIRESDIVRDAPAFTIAFESAKFLGISKPMTGPGNLGKLLAKINR